MKKEYTQLNAKQLRQNILKSIEIYGFLQTELMCNQFMQPLHSNLYIRGIHKKLDYANIMLSNS